MLPVNCYSVSFLFPHYSLLKHSTEFCHYHYHLYYSFTKIFLPKQYIAIIPWYFKLYINYIYKMPNKEKCSINAVILVFLLWHILFFFLLTLHLRFNMLRHVVIPLRIYSMSKDNQSPPIWKYIFLFLLQQLLEYSHQFRDDSLPRLLTRFDLLTDFVK